MPAARQGLYRATSAGGTETLRVGGAYPLDLRQLPLVGRPAAAYARRAGFRQQHWSHRLRRLNYQGGIRAGFGIIIYLCPSVSICGSPNLMYCTQLPNRYITKLTRAKDLMTDDEYNVPEQLLKTLSHLRIEC
ncbi:hypothetical protein SAMD00079811_23670 [Scytonema sp. HK-05]|nr:hypothetical protein SAMD00079811_23670 [Scytonema sp. HK-05]